MLEPASLRPHYSQFLAAPKSGGEARILLTGHSHQAWPDVAKQGLLQAFDDAALHVDDKWSRAFDQARTLQEYIAAQLAGAEPEQIALGQNTHELVARFISALDLQQRPRIVSTQGEFHSLRRQLTRLAEAGVEVVLVPVEPVASLCERLAASLNAQTAAVLVSSVLFETSTQVHGLPQLAERAEALGVELLVDAYHAFGVLPLSLSQLGGERAFITAGGYKYAQWGEGCCFLRVPKDCALRPVFTGWFSDFAGLDRSRGGELVGYGNTPSDRFAGSTYDPSSHYRAARVVRFFQEQQLSIEKLRELSLHQTNLLITQLLAGGLGVGELLSPTEPAERGGFVAVRERGAQEVTARLRKAGVYVDSRGDVLRFGPAPYSLDHELERAVARYFELRAG